MNPVKKKFVRLPKGFYWKVAKDCGSIYIILYNGKIRIGRLYLENTGKNKFITHCRVDDLYLGKGYGILLYAKAIRYCHNRGYKIRSSGYSSFQALRVWESSRLRQYFNIKCRRGIVRSLDIYYPYPKC